MMTGTAKTEVKEEFREIYNMQVIQIPTNKPILRDDRADLLYPTLRANSKQSFKTSKSVTAKDNPCQGRSR